MAKGSKKNAKPNVFVRIVQYVKNVRTEMKRVVWPSREEVISSSLIVIVTVVAFTLFVLVVDQIASFTIIDQLAKIGR